MLENSHDLKKLHHCKIMIDGQEWSSTEQYFQYEKAMTAGEKEKAGLIRATDDPYEAMYLGKEISTDKTEWPKRAEDVMKRAVEAKFSIPNLKLALKKTEKILGEATGNQIWGTGIPMGWQDAYKQSAWPGKNVLGNILIDLKTRMGLNIK